MLPTPSSATTTNGRRSRALPGGRLTTQHLKCDRPGRLLKLEPTRDARKEGVHGGTRGSPVLEPGVPPRSLHHVRHASGHPGADALLLRRLRDDCLGREDVLRDRGGVLERGARDHRRVDDPGLHEVLVLAGLDVQALALRGGPDLVDDHRALEARVVGELPDRLLESADYDERTRALISFELVDLDRLDRVQERDPAAGDDPFLERGPRCLERVLDAMLLLLHLCLGRRPDLDHGDAAGQLGQPLLQLLAVEVGVGRLDLGLQLLDAGLDRVRLAGAVDDRRRVLVDDDLAGLAELRELRVLELEAHLLGDHLGAGEDGDVLEHPLAAVAEARSLDGDCREGPPELVDDDRRQRLALDVLRDDEQRLAGLDHLLEHRQEILDGPDLLVRDQDVRLVEHRLHALGVGDHVGREVALVELHALGELELEPEGLALLDVDDAVLADLLDRIRDDVADLALARRDRCDPGDVLLARDLLRLSLEALDDVVDGLLDAALQPHRVRAGSDVLQALADDRLGKDGRGRRAVAGDVVCRRRDLTDELSALVLEDVLDLDLARDRDAVVCNRRCAEFLVEHDVPTLRAKGDLDRISEDVDPALERAPGVLVELQLLMCHSLLPSSYARAPASSRFLLDFAAPLLVVTFASTSDSRRMSTSSVPSLISVPPYFEKMISSPLATSIGTISPRSLRAPGPTASTRPRWGFSFAVSGRTIPLEVVSSSSRTSTMRRSPSGCRFIHDLLVSTL